MHKETRTHTSIGVTLYVPSPACLSHYAKRTAQTPSIHAKPAEMLLMHSISIYYRDASASIVFAHDDGRRFYPDSNIVHKSSHAGGGNPQPETHAQIETEQLERIQYSVCVAWWPDNVITKMLFAIFGRHSDPPIRVPDVHW